MQRSILQSAAVVLQPVEAQFAHVCRATVQTGALQVGRCHKWRSRYSISIRKRTRGSLISSIHGMISMHTRAGTVMARLRQDAYVLLQLLVRMRTREYLSAVPHVLS